jgi:hypothetical protein
MERLTESNPSWIDDELWERACEPDCEEIDAVYRKLKEYEDLEEQGRLIKLPCKVGDMLYYPDKEFNIIIPMRLTEIVIKFNGLDTSSCQYDCSSFDECGDVYEEYEFDTNDFGKSVFLIKSEAEAKLKELRGGKNGSME